MKKNISFFLLFFLLLTGCQNLEQEGRPFNLFQVACDSR